MVRALQGRSRVKRERRTKEGFRRFFAYLEETGLKYPLRLITRNHGTTLFDVYMDVSLPGAVAARYEIWWYLTADAHRSPAEVADLFDRNRSSVVFVFRRLRELAEERTVSVAPDTIGVLSTFLARPRVRSTP